ncbi:DUF3307 domain-containing protein [Gaoshiqia sp. Z1-71]|uniref:DUF3307 domain-containing protein n=1 Tax=Gaoshiqia hydrogeniformans TaxID=3290090 RepID=UPI003BF8C245
MILILRLLLAHFIADFLLQPRSWVNDKNQYGIKSIRLFYHILIVTFLSALFTIDYFTWKIPVFIFLLHYLTDLAKIYLKPKKVNHLLWFLADQIVHLFIIWFIAGLADENFRQYAEILTGSLTNEKILIYLLSYFFIVWPSMIIINLATRYWQKQVNQELEPNLKNAGKWIGILERILVLTFVLSAQFQAIGFLIAAKSILRISVKNEATARIMSEYVLIGTLISFTIAIMTGILANSAL